MKKTLMALAAVVMMFILTGCGTETLTCTMSQDQTGMKMDQKVVATFENNEVTKMNMKIDVNLDDSYKAYADTMKTMLEEEYKTFSDNGGKVEVTGKDSIININIDLDLKSMTSDQKKNLEMTDTFGTKDATAKELEKQGYTCK